MYARVNKWTGMDKCADCTVGFRFPKMADLLVLRVVKRCSGVKNCLLCIVEQLWNVFQVLCRTLEWKHQQREHFRIFSPPSNLKPDKGCMCKYLCETWQSVMCVHLTYKVSRCVQIVVISRLEKSVREFNLTSTHVSISENWFMMGRMVSIELPQRRSDLFPTRMMGTLM